MAVQERGPEAGPDAVPASSATAPVPAASGLATAGWRGHAPSWRGLTGLPFPA